MKFYKELLVFTCIFVSANAGLFSNIANTIGRATYNTIEDVQILSSANVKVVCISQYQKELQTVPINDSSVTTKIDFSKKLSIFIHGYISSMHETRFVKYRKAWVKSTSDNLCFVDWEILSYGLYPVVSTVNARVVQIYVTSWIKFIVSVGYSLNRVQIVGHSLGAHIAGFVGKNFDGEIGEIVGLDPAGPGFSQPILVSSDDRLTKTDAVYVLIVHSCDGTYGIGYDIGNTDFYINTGTIPQPGCGALNPIPCAHERALSLYQDSFTSNGKNCLGIYCSNRMEYSDRKCNENNTDYLGPKLTQRKEGRFYLSTGTEPICTGHFYEN